MIETVPITGEFHIPVWVDFVALMMFGITGALSAAKREYDWLGVLAIALVTGAGGGLIRDVLLNVKPALLQNEPYLWAVIIALIISVFFCGILSRFRWVFRVADALGLSLYAVIGTQKAINQGLGMMASILIGTLNAIGGGLIRDILTQQEVTLLKPGELYAMIAFAACIAFWIVVNFTSIPSSVAGGVIILLAFVAKLFAYRHNIRTRALKPRGYDSSHW